jgi:ArsR family transcriptional regulator, zinc-responsive transcriptional repressor
MTRKIMKNLNLLPVELLEQASECFRLLAHPARLRIIEILMQGKFAVHEIAGICNLNPNQTCDHLRLLKGHRILESKRCGRIVYYTIAAPQAIEIIECIRRNYSCI